MSLRFRTPTHFPDPWSDEEEITPLADPVAIMAAVLLDSLPASARAALNQPGSHTVVRVISPAWAGPIHQVLRSRHLAGCRRQDAHPEDTSEDGTRSRALVVHRTVPWMLGHGGRLQTEIQTAVARSRPVIGVSHAPRTCLPPGLGHWGVEVTVPMPDEQHLRCLLRRLTGERPTRLSPDLAHRLTPEVLAEGYVPGVGARVLHDALVALTGARPVAARSEGDARLTLRQHGLTAWGEGIVGIVAAWRDGRGDWPQPSMTVLLAGSAPAAREAVGALATLTRAQVVPVPLGRSKAVLEALGEAITRCRVTRRRTVLLVHVEAVDLLGMAGEPSRAALVALLEQAGPGVVIVGATDAPLAIDQALLVRFGRIVRVRQDARTTHTIH